MIISELHRWLWDALHILSAVAVHHHHSGGEGADHRGVSGLSVPGGQHLLAALVGSQPAGRLAAPRRPLPDLLRHVRLHGPGLCGWVWITARCRTCPTAGPIFLTPKVQISPGMSLIKSPGLVTQFSSDSSLIQAKGSWWVPDLQSLVLVFAWFVVVSPAPPITCCKQVDWEVK